MSKLELVATGGYVRFEPTDEKTLAVCMAQPAWYLFRIGNYACYRDPLNRVWRMKL